MCYSMSILGTDMKKIVILKFKPIFFSIFVYFLGGGGGDENLLINFIWPKCGKSVGKQ